MSQNLSQHETCPKCEKPKHLDLMDCPYCGVIYKKVAAKALDQGPQARIDLQLLNQWEQLLENYNDEKQHEVFIQRALATKNLAFASQQYRKMLEVSPEDEVARKMQDRIVQLASIQFMSMKREDVPAEKSTLRYLFLILSVLSLVGGIVIKSMLLYVLAAVFLFLSFSMPLLKRKWQQ